MVNVLIDSAKNALSYRLRKFVLDYGLLLSEPLIHIELLQLQCYRNMYIIGKVQMIIRYIKIQVTVTLHKLYV